jgi:histidine kinase
MNLTSRIRSRLGFKLFLSYLAIILTGILVLGVSAEFVIPTAFNNHMSAMMGRNGMMGGMMGDLGNDLYANFRAAITEALFRAGLSAFVIAVVVSIFISRRVVSPVQEMTLASQHIAEGNYDQRVDIPGSPGNADELGQLAIRFNQMAEKLSQTEEMRRQLIGDVSHELRTPLTAIKGSLEGLIDGVLPPTPETFQNIYQETDRLQRLVADLQELSRVEAGAVPLELESCGIPDLIQSVVQRLQPQFEEKGIVLALEIPSALPRVRVDQDRIAQVLINLLGNALQYTSENGHVTLAVQQIGNELQISIQDTGVGISAEHLPHLFTRFYRVDKSRSRAGGGSGIGLTISKHLVEAHDGRIWAESNGPGKGSTFSFVLPTDPRFPS